MGFSYIRVRLTLQTGVRSVWTNEGLFVHTERTPVCRDVGHWIQENPKNLLPQPFWHRFEEGAGALGIGMRRWKCMLFCFMRMLGRWQGV